MKNKHAFICVALITLCTFCFCQNLHADESVIKVGVYSNPPKISIDDKGHAVGFWPELITYIAGQEHWNIEFVWGSWEGNLERLNAGEINILPDVAVTEARKELFQFSREAVLLSWSQLYIKKTVSDFHSIFDLNGKKVAVLSGSVNYTGPEGIRDLVRKFNVACTFVEFANYADVFNAVQSNLAFAGVTNNNYGTEHAEQYGLKQAPLTFQPIAINFAFPKASNLSNALSSAIDQQIKTLKNTPGSVYYQLLGKYLEPKVLGPHTTTFPSWMKPLIILLILTVFIAFVALIIFRVKFKQVKNKIEQKHRELFEQEAKFHLLLNNQKESVFLQKVLPEGISLFYEVNDTAVKLYGYTRDEFLQIDSSQIFTSEALDDYLNSGKRRRLLKQGELIFEATHVTRSGTCFPVEVSSSVIELKGEKHILSTVRDITARTLTEKKYETLVKEATVGIALADAQTGEILECNDTLANMVERTRDELIGQPQTILHPEQPLLGHLTQNFVRNRDANTGQTTQNTCMSKSGRIFPVEIKARRINHDGRDMLLGIFQDISARHELEQQLRQKYKMEAVGLLAGGMAHNFNNNLSIILGSVELATLRTAKDSRVKELLDNAKTAILRSRDLIQQIMIYSRKGVQEKSSINVSKVIDETLKLLHSTIPSTVKLQYQAPPSDREISIQADSTRIQEALLNLCTNAVHAMDEKGRITISLDTVNLRQIDISAQYQCQPGDFARISVQDTGCGISTEIMERMFDPFFTTKNIDQGTGMGLSTVQGMIKQNNGMIKVHSVPGQGATFELYLPLVQERQTEPLIERRAFPRGSERILFLDDDEMLADLGALMLSELGYQVTAMTSSTETLKRIQTDPGCCDLLITDQTMPEMSGKELILELQKTNPDLPTILCTGYSSKIDEKEAERLGIKAFLLKPIDFPELLRIMRQVFDQGQKNQSGNGKF